MSETKSALYSYPRTSHVPSSPGATSDDKHLTKAGLNYLTSGVELITSEKMDGGNLSLYPDYFHGRSKDSGTHHWDTLAKSIWSRVRFDIPEGWRISAESMYARRSVAYDDLESPLFIIGIWDETNSLISWDDTVEWAALFGLPTVPLIYRGNDWEQANKAWSEQFDTEASEGYVIRDAGKIRYEDFSTHVAKWVRKDHVRTSADWRHRDDYAVNTFRPGAY